MPAKWLRSSGPSIGLKRGWSPIEAWPESISTIVGLVLSSPLVSSVALLEDRLLIYNEAAARLYGDKHPRALGKPLMVAFPESYGHVESFYDRVFEGETVTVCAQPLAVSSETSEEIFDAYLTPVRGADGSVIGAHMIGLEVGATRRAEYALRASELRYRGFVTASADVVYRMSPDWTRMQELDGQGFVADTVEPDESWMDRYILAEDRAEVRAAIDTAIAGRVMFGLEHRLIRADGSPG